MTFDDNPSAPSDSSGGSLADRPGETASTGSAGAPSTTPSAPDFVVVQEPHPYVAVAGQRMSDQAVREDLRVPWGWLSLLLFVIVTAAGLLFVGVIAVGIYMGAGGSIETLQKSTSVQGLLSVIVQFFVDFGWLGFFAIMLRAVYRQPFWRTIGWRPLTSSRFPKAAVYLAFVAGGILLAVIVTAASNLFPPKGQLPVEELLQDRNTAMLFALMSVAVAPLVEETLFRGYLYPLVARSFGVGTGIVFTGAVFGLLHAPQLNGAWFQVLLLIFVGIIFTIARAATKTIAASFLLHISYNSLQVLGLILETHGFRQMHVLH